MKKIKKMIESAPSKTMAREMLNTWIIFGHISQEQYEKGRKLITNEFKTHTL
jgi:hypothetical protein